MVNYKLDIFVGSLTIRDKHHVYTQVAQPLLELALQQMAWITDEDDALEPFDKAKSRINRWSILEKGGAPNQIFQKE